jgi:hypothetical protein
MAPAWQQQHRHDQSDANPMQTRMISFTAIDDREVIGMIRSSNGKVHLTRLHFYSMRVCTS